MDLQTIYASFTVEIIDPCRTAILQDPATTQPIANMTLIRNLDPILTQTFTIISDVEVNDLTLTCNKVFNLVNPPPFVTISGSTISVDPALTSDADLGTHTIAVQVDSADYAAAV